MGIVPIGEFMLSNPPSLSLFLLPPFILPSLPPSLSPFLPPSLPPSLTEHQYMQLYEACRHGNLESLESAIKSGLPVNARDKYNKTPLMVACAHGRSDVAEFLLSRG